MHLTHRLAPCPPPSLTRRQRLESGSVATQLAGDQLHRGNHGDPLVTPAPRPRAGGISTAVLAPGAAPPSPCLRFFCGSQRTPPHLPARTAAARHGPLWLGRVLLLLVSSLLTHRAFQRAELSPALGIKEPSEQGSLCAGFPRLSGRTRPMHELACVRVLAFGICTMMAGKASEARTNKLLFLQLLTPVPCLFHSVAFPAHP